jgi:hypothetical protein
MGLIHLLQSTLIKFFQIYKSEGTKGGESTVIKLKNRYNMKTIILTTTIALLLTLAVMAQAPQAFKYQAVIRNNQGKVLVSQHWYHCVSAF